jgi:hypothetical protein
MTQPLHYTPKAIECLANLEGTASPAASVGIRYLTAKLRLAQVFVLPDHGSLLDRSKPRPEVAGLTFQPAFPVVALEYPSPAATGRVVPGYTDAPSSKRIALAWRWTDDLPVSLRRFAPPVGDGVAIASICWFDELQLWLPVAAAAHMTFEDEWKHLDPLPFVQAAAAAGSVSPSIIAARTYPFQLLPMLPDALGGMVQALGPSGATDHLAADLNDEINAYTDLCYALACKNVETREHPAPAALNKSRLKAGKLPLKSFHVLELNGGGDMPGTGTAVDRAGPRSHLRRGHIRRLPGERVTWVNSTVVRGRGFVDKVYAA